MEDNEDIVMSKDYDSIYELALERWNDIMTIKRLLEKCNYEVPAIISDDESLWADNVKALSEEREANLD